VATYSSTHFSIYLFIHPSATYLSVLSTYSSTHFSIYLFIHPSATYLSTYLPSFLSNIYLCTLSNLPIYLSICLSIYISSIIYLPFYLQTHFSIYHLCSLCNLSIYLPIYLSIYLSIIYLSSIYLSICLSIHVPVYPSMSLIHVRIRVRVYVCMTTCVSACLSVRFFLCVSAFSTHIFIYYSCAHSTIVILIAQQSEFVSFPPFLHLFLSYFFPHFSLRVPSC
jgi:hypothetical protein